MSAWKYRRSQKYFNPWLHEFSTNFFPFTYKYSETINLDKAHREKKERFHYRMHSSISSGDTGENALTGLEGVRTL